MKLATLTLAALLLPLSAHAAAWKVDMAHSTLGFSGAFQGDAFHGRFKHFKADIHYDPQHLSKDRFDVTVQLGSVDTQSPERDQTLKGSDFFAVSKDPVAHFVTHAFHRDANGGVTADGTLTLHGVTQPVALQVTFKPQGKTATLDVKTTLKRLAFKLGTASDWKAISKTIDVHGHLLLHRAS